MVRDGRADGTGHRQKGRDATRPSFSLGNSWPTGMLWLAAIVLASLTIFPTLYAFFLSLTDARLITPQRHLIGLTNYLTLPMDKGFWHAAGVTLQYVVAVLAVELPLGLWLAISLNTVERFRTAFRLIMLLPLTLPPIAAGLMWKLFLQPGTGLSDLLLTPLGLAHVNWFGSPSLALWSILLIDVYLFTPFATLILLAGLQDLPMQTLEAATIDGAGKWGLFRYVIMPYLSPRLYLVSLFRIAYALTSFDLIAATTNGGPGTATTNLSYHVYLTGYLRYFIGNATAIGVVLFVLMFAIAQFLSRRSQEGWR